MQGTRQHLAGKRRVSGVTVARNQTSLSGSARSLKASMLAFHRSKIFLLVCLQIYGHNSFNFNQLQFSS
jgi:hypothetical protein